jgi:hypothetical protein
MSARFSLADWRSFDAWEIAMTGDEATLRMLDSLDDLRIPYILVGSFASNFYGIPRSTADADIVVQMAPEFLSGLIANLGPQFRLDPQLAFETVTMTTYHTIEVVSIPFKIELFQLSEDAHDQERFRRRRCVKLLNRQVFLPTPEDVVVTKVRWALQGERSKDRDDARDVIAVQADRLDWSYIFQWCDLHGTRGLLEDIRRSIPLI